MAIGLALAAAIVFGTGDFMGGLATRRGPVLTVLLLSQVIGLVGMAVASAVTGGTPGGGDMIAGAVGGIAGGAGVTLLYLGLASGEMALVAPITGVVAAVIPVVAGIVIGERPSPVQDTGIAAAVVAVALLSGASPGRHATPRLAPVLLALGSGAAFGVFYIALARAAPAAGLWPLVFARCASVTLFGLALLVRRERLKAGASGLRLIAGTGVFDVAANALYLLAVHQGLLSIVAVLVSLYPAATVGCSMLFLRERLQLLQLGGVALALVAVTLVSLG